VRLSKLRNKEATQTFDVDVLMRMAASANQHTRAETLLQFLSNIHIIKALTFRISVGDPIALFSIVIRFKVCLVAAKWHATCHLFRTLKNWSILLLIVVGKEATPV